MSVNFRSLLASLLAFITLAFMPAAFAATASGQVTLAPSYKATYVASSAYFTPVASATDLGVMNGSASKNVHVLKVLLNYQSATAGTLYVDSFAVVKRSTANSGGTSTTLTSVPLNSANTATAVAKIYTANPTTGSTVGTIAVGQGVSGIAGDNTLVLFDADKYGQACDLNGTAQGLAVNHNGVTVQGSSPLIQITYIWTED